MADRTSAQPNRVKEESFSIKQELPAEEEEELSSIQQELPAEEEEELSSIQQELPAEEASTMRREDDLMSYLREYHIPSSPSLQKKSDKLSNYLKILSKNQTSTLDTVYGVRSLTSGWKIGDKPISFVDDKISVGNEQYEKTLEQQYEQYEKTQLNFYSKSDQKLGLLNYEKLRETTNKSFERVMLTERIINSTVVFERVQSHKSPTHPLTMFTGTIRTNLSSVFDYC